MFNPFTYQGGTATIDGQPTSMNGQSRIPEFVTPVMAQNPGIYGQAYGYPAAFPGITTPAMINPLTGTPNTIPFVNTIPGFNTIPNFSSSVYGQPAVNTPWGVGATYPTIPNIYGALPATTFGIPAVQPFFGAGLSVNPFTGVVQPALPTTPFTTPVSPWGMNTPFVSPIAANPWINPIAAQVIQNAMICGVPAAAAAAFLGTPNPVYNTVGVPNIFGVNPLTSAINPFLTVGATNPFVSPTSTFNTCGHVAPGVPAPHFLNNVANRAFGVNPFLNSAASLGFNPLATAGIGWNPASSNVFGGVASNVVNPLTSSLFGINPFAIGHSGAGVVSPCNAPGTTPWNTTGLINNPWVNSYAQNFSTLGNYGINPLTSWMNPAMGLANNFGTNSLGFSSFFGATAPFANGLVNPSGCWPTFGI